MRWFDIGGEASGVVAIGQYATGVFAFGQVAHGIVAVGQVAVGVVAIGQVALGGVTVGMVAGGVYYAVAMLGVGGRGFGWVLPLLPSLGDPIELPQATPLAELTSTRAAEGWIRAAFASDGAELALYEDRVHLQDVRLDARLRRAALDEGTGEVLAHVRRFKDGWVADRLIRVPVPRLLEPQWWLVWALQLIGLAALSVIVWWLCVDPLFIALFGPGGVFR